MSSSDRLRLAIVGAQFDANDVGEAWCGYQWISRISQHADVTLLTLRHPGRVPPAEQLPGARVIEWDSFPFFSRMPRLNQTIKPWYPHFYFTARAWLRKAIADGEHFDLLHHLTPMAMRYPSPCPGLGVPYVIGPIAGGLPTPDGFKAELDTEPVFAKLRVLDRFRLKHDPSMRRSYQDAEAVICSGPYAAEALSHLKLKRIEYDTEVGIEALAPEREDRKRQQGALRLVFVGRVVRTKGLRDAVRALAKLSDLPGVTLDVAGDGEDLPACRDEAQALGISDRVRFHGRLAHDAVERLYAESDVFLFPSFREPTGIVLFEAMKHGLPIITTNIGGPGHIVDDSCGIRLKAEEPGQFAEDIASAIRELANDPVRVAALETGARQRVIDIGLWEPKIDRLLALYDSVLQDRTGR